MPDLPPPDDVARAMQYLGLRVLAPVGAEGTAWLGEPIDGPGSPVELHVVPAVVDDALAARADALRAIHHDHLPVVHDVLEIAPGRLALVVEHVDGPSLRMLRASRAPLTDAEAAGVAIPLAGALEALHAAGTAHGAVSGSSVVIRPDGRPVLVDLRDSLLGSGTAAGDVAHLVATLLAQMPDEDAHRAAGDPAGTLREALVELVSEPVPAAAVAVTCLRVVPPEPLRLPDDAVLAGSGVAAWSSDTALADTALAGDLLAGDVPPGEETAWESVHQDVRAHARRTAADLRVQGKQGKERTRSGRRGRWGRSRVLAVVGASVVVLLLVALGAAALTSSRLPWTEERRDLPAGSEATSPAATTDAATPGSLAQTAEDLTVRRAEVLADGDVAALTDLEVPDGPAHVADQALMASLADVTLEGYGVDVLATEELDAAENGDARVAVTSSARAHVREGADGRSQVPATQASTVVLVLRSTDAGWRVWDVEAAP
ncbi:hypothetical protein [Cellulomonas soli]|uniref:hypothetical protein n=1 Tax=Cellulomonas soli TaxID=931535 RepID=UPI0011BEA934|nr:hypothetical protein [Cellulomonas soli]NYI60397.1 hypothetical protein [Cellulomonas soli]